MEYKHFTLIVVGDNPDDLIKKYDSNYNVQRHLIYKFKDAEKYKLNRISLLKESLNYIKDEKEKKSIMQRIKELQDTDNIDYYALITEGYDIDEKTGDAYLKFNKFGKYDSCNIAKHFAIPLIDKNGTETYQALKKDIDWNKIHLANQEVYEFVWDSVMNGKKPITENEKTLYENMKNRTAYLSYFKTKDKYVASNTAFWGSAFLSKKTDWVEPNEHNDQYDWIINFFDRFIKPLKNNEKITIYEFTRVANL